ncbi:MAG: 50S ribosomal protein L17 [Candidatus Dadabacteria bacterium]|nr:50S ribosomal protein L17 [Candidatus Dadabacteria bacterium]NIQ14589.1 50S ribosomal protein L17 [Candidatus Dadabacteria bacterium]
MRHKRVGRKLGVTTKHRKAMFRNMATDLLRHDSIKTTDTRAKEIRRVVEKLITLAKKGTLEARRKASGYVRDKEVVKKLFSDLAEKYQDRPGGYTRIIKLGYRKGDNAPISLIELVQEEFKQKKKRKPKKKHSEEQTAKQSTETKSSKKESAEELGLVEKEVAAAEIVDQATEVVEAVEQPEVSEDVEPKDELKAESQEPIDEETIADSEDVAIEESSSDEEE